MILGKKPFENIVRKRENAGNQHFLISAQCSSFRKTNFRFSVIFIILLPANAFDWSKDLSFGKELRTGGYWFNLWLALYSFQGLMIVIARGFIPLSKLSIMFQ